MSKRAATYLRSIGIDATLHHLRHRFATAVYQSSGKDIRTTQELMRHKSPDTTAICTQCQLSTESRPRTGFRSDTSVAYRLSFD